MRIKNLLNLFTGIVLCCLIGSCKQKQQGNDVTPTADNKNTQRDSLVLPVTVIVTDDALEGHQINPDDYPKTWAVEWCDTAVTPIAVYGASHALWLGPKGYRGRAAAGADGSVAVQLFPRGGSDAKPPFVRYQSIPACVGCMMSAAAPFFENAKADLLTNYDSAMLDVVHTPDRLVIQKKSTTLVTYTYYEGSSLQISGVAYYSSPTTSSRGYFEQAEFALGPENKALTDLLVKSYISMRGLK